MRLPHAIRVDHDPFFSPPVEVPGVPRRGFPLAFLAILRWTSYACPHCHGIFRRDFWPYNVRLGSGERVCMKCGKPFDDGAREWPELRWAPKLRFFLPPGIQAVGGSLLFCAIFTLLIAPRDVVNWRASILAVCIFLSPIFVWCLVRLLSILRSKHRFENDPSSIGRKLEAGRTT
jgi:hypothetical protein